MVASSTAIRGTCCHADPRATYERLAVLFATIGVKNLTKVCELLERSAFKKSPPPASRSAELVCADISNQTTMIERVNRAPSVYLRRSSTWLVGGFAALALLQRWANFDCRRSLRRNPERSAGQPPQPLSHHNRTPEVRSISSGNRTTTFEASSPPVNRREP